MYAYREVSDCLSFEERIVLRSCILNVMALMRPAFRKMKRRTYSAMLRFVAFVPEAAVTIRQVANGNPCDRSVALGDCGGWDSSHGAHLGPGGAGFGGAWRGAAALWFLGLYAGWNSRLGCWLGVAKQASH